MVAQVPLGVFLSTFLSLLVAACLQPSPPHAACKLQLAQSRERPVFMGVGVEDITIDCQDAASPVTAHVIAIDLDSPGLSFITSEPAGNQGDFDFELTTHFLMRSRSQVAFNANLFTNCCLYKRGQGVSSGQLLGLEVSEGRVSPGLRSDPDSPPAPYSTSLVVRGRAVRILTAPPMDPSISFAVTGSHALVVDGRNIAPTDSAPDFFKPNPRTIVGLRADNRKMWLVAVEGIDGTAGLTLPQAAEVMIELGAASALNLDGGGSTSLAVDDGHGGAGLINVPSTGTPPCDYAVGSKCERYVGASFGIKAMALPKRP